MKIKHKFVLGRWLPPVLWAIMIYIFSSLPQIVVSQFFVWDFVAKKTAHVAEYAILYALIYRATSGGLFVSFFLTIVYALSDEFHQSFVPGRTATLYDLGFDFSGGSIAAYIIWRLKPGLKWLNRLRPNKRKK